jgi:hypothetical protein
MFFVDSFIKISTMQEPIEKSENSDSKKMYPEFADMYPPV